MKRPYDLWDLVLALLAAIGVATVIVLFVGCSTYRIMSSYNLRSMVVEAHYYHARYIDVCHGVRAAVDVPCAQWEADQSALDQAEGEATDSRKIGGNQTLQMKMLKKKLDVVVKGYAQWAF
jgi:hypothetical protein